MIKVADQRDWVLLTSLCFAPLISQEPSGAGMHGCDVGAHPIPEHAGINQERFLTRKCERHHQGRSQSHADCNLQSNTDNDNLDDLA